jgi:hypothetical protein
MQGAEKASECLEICVITQSIGSNGGQLRQKSLGVAIAIGPIPTGQQCEHLTSVATQIPGSSQSDGLQEQECEQQTTQGYRLASDDTQRWISRGEVWGEGRLQAGKQRCFLHGR